MVGKAEHLSKGANPRFMVTNIPTTERAAKELYEQNDCGRGEMENRIKEQQLCLFADRTSCKTLRANQLRHWLSTLAYVLLNVLRERGLQGTRPIMFGVPQSEQSSSRSERPSQSPFAKSGSNWLPHAPIIRSSLTRGRTSATGKPRAVR